MWNGDSATKQQSSSLPRRASIPSRDPFCCIFSHVAMSRNNEFIQIIFDEEDPDVLKNQHTALMRTLLRI